MQPPGDKRPDPDQLLRHVQALERAEVRGRLKIFLGYAAGVGKSFRMFDEGRRRKARGSDVIVGAVQHESGPDVEALLADFEIISLLGTQPSSAIDIVRILRRHPQVCLVDGLAYTNPSGSRNPHRWQDVAQLLEAGITILTSLNIYYIEERRDAVEKIVGKRGQPAVPESFLSLADEIEIVDVPPEVLVHRINGLTPHEAEAERCRLSELREIALLVAADVVDAQLHKYLLEHGIEESWGTQERIMVCLTPRSNAAAMIRSGRRNAQRFRGELFVVSVKQPEMNAEDQAGLEQALALAREAEARVALLDGEDPIGLLLDFARLERITQIFVGHSIRESWWAHLFGGPLDRLIRNAEGMDVRVFPH